MKALHLTNEFPPHVYGGAGVHVEYLSRELAKLMDVEVRCFGDQDVTAGRLRVKGSRADERLLLFTDARLRAPLDALQRCMQFTAAPIDADVVHCHTWYTCFAGIVARLAYGVPLVITVHSLEPQRAWKRQQLGRGYDLSSWIEKTALEMADCLITVSEGMKADVLRLLDPPPSRVHVVRNGIDTDEYRPVTGVSALAQYGIDSRRPYVLFVGRITRQKGILHLVNAIQYLLPDTQVVLCAGAPDTEEIGEQTSAAVRQAQARRPGVIWIPQMVDRRTAIELYSHAAVFCCPSIYEPFGLINLEAMACCTPVVASAVGGIPEVVSHGETGLLVELEPQPTSPFEPVNPERFARDLAAAINRLIADEGLRRRMGAAGRARAVERFSWSVVAQQVAGLYAAVVHR